MALLSRVPDDGAGPASATSGEHRQLAGGYKPYRANLKQTLGPVGCRENGQIPAKFKFSV